MPMIVSSTFSPFNVQNKTISRQQVQDMKCKSKWTEVKRKISGIYVDWIEDTPFLPSS